VPIIVFIFTEFHCTVIVAADRSFEKPHFTKDFLIVMDVISLWASATKCTADNISSFICAASWSSSKSYHGCSLGNQLLSVMVSQI
jgi:uncharacterized protein YgiB involved in biofilm formation